MDEFLTPTQLKKLRVVDLKEKLTALGLPLNGLKADLIKRLSDFYESQARVETPENSNIDQHPPTDTSTVDTNESVNEQPEPVPIESASETPQEISDLENLLNEALQAKQNQCEESINISTDAEVIKEVPKASVPKSQIDDVNIPYTENDQQPKKLSKNAKKKRRKKRRTVQIVKPVEDIVDDGDFDIEIIEEEIPKDLIYFQFEKVFARFAENTSKDVKNIEDDSTKKILDRKKPAELEFKEDDGKNDGELKLSKRKLKQLERMTVSELKQKVSHPELVEMHDVTAKDPLLLLHLKSTRNSVPVPRHWCFKRKYLQGKRGFEKPAFKLPEFIRRTGIMELRAALQEKEEAKSLKNKQREKTRPKLGKIDIDYQKLHDAFFKWQTKPKMTIHGDLYYEGKEFDVRFQEKKPGDLSVELRVALGMPTGPNAHKCPPPWLIAMQRYGPPPSYPNLKIPGLNARIPDGCSFGYHAGGWGKPPVDEYGRPLYGDVFGLSSAQDDSNIEEQIEKTLWGELEVEEEMEEEEEEEEEEAEDESEVEKSSEYVAPEGLDTPSGFASIETPQLIELRKRKIEAEIESNESPALFKVIPEKKAGRIEKEMMASTHTYDLSGSLLVANRVDVSLDPGDLEMPVAGLTAKYEKSFKEQKASLAKEDLSDMVAEHAAQKRKKTQDSSKSNKKYKDFKF